MYEICKIANANKIEKINVYQISKFKIKFKKSKVQSLYT